MGVLKNMRCAKNVGTFQFPAAVQLTFASGRSECLKCHGCEVIRLVIALGKLADCQHKTSV